MLSNFKTGVGEPKQGCNYALITMDFSEKRSTDIFVLNLIVVCLYAHSKKIMSKFKVAVSAKVETHQSIHAIDASSFIEP